MDETMLSSSPDPLNDSPTFHFKSPQKSTQKTRRSTRFSLPLQGSSPKKQTFELDVGNDISPQKIRVTVEAGSSDAENAYNMDNGSPSPVRAQPPRRREWTRTTTVPVKGLSESEDEMRAVATTPKRRGRPRRSGTPVPAKKRTRASTPQASSKRKSFGDLVDGDDEDDIDFHLGRGVEIGRGRGGSRGTSRKSTGATKQTDPFDNLVSSAPGKKGKGRRKSSQKDQVAMSEDQSNGTRDKLQNDQAEMSGALEPIDSNSVYPPSEFSINGGVESDLPARSDSGNHTPSDTKRSSPPVKEASVPSSSRNSTHGYPSPTNSVISQPEGEDLDMEMEMEPNSPASHETEDDEIEEEHYTNGHDDATSRFPMDDTIFESEGFSMISVDSVPSLRNLTPAIPQENTSSKPVRNKSLLSLHQEASHDDFSTLPGEVLETGTPAPKPQNLQLFSVKSTHIDDSFSSVPPEILDAASPVKKTQVSRLLSRTNSRIEDSFSSVPQEVLDAASPLKAPPKSGELERPQNAHENPFSANPPAVLDATTPSIIQPAIPSADKLSVPRLSSRQKSRSRPSSSSAQAMPPPVSRLPTPEETPSPPVDDPSIPLSGGLKGNASMPELPQAIPEVSIVNDSSVMQSQMPSSPPYISPHRFTYTQHLREHPQLNQNMTQTPSIVFSSPTLPPPIHPLQTSLAPSLQLGPRPPLSPIARTGQALQNIPIPSSPRSRSQSLGSPFKSPSIDRTSVSSAKRDSLPSPVRIGPLPRLDLNGQLSSHSTPFRDSVSARQDDPFSTDEPRKHRSPSPKDKQQYSLELPQQNYLSNPRLNTIRSQVNSVRSEDAMSWQAEEETSVRQNFASKGNGINSSLRIKGQVEKEQNISSTRLTWEERAELERAAVKRQIAEANSSKVIVIGSDGPGSDENEVEDEDFKLLLETLNSSSPAPEERQEPLRDTVEKPRRSKIPSPWRQNSKRLVYSDELSYVSTKEVLGKNSATSDISKDNMPHKPIATRRVTPEPTVRLYANDAELRRKMDSVAPEKVLPGTDFPEEIKPRKPINARRVIPTPDINESMNSSDFSAMHIPQKMNFKPRGRQTSQPLYEPGMSPIKPLPVPSREPCHNSTVEISSSSRIQSVETYSENSSTTVETGTKQQTGFTPIPQKAAFQPRPRANSPEKQPLIPRIFGGKLRDETQVPTPEIVSSSPVSHPLTNSSPSRHNTLASQHLSSAQKAPKPTFINQERSPTASMVDENDEEEWDWEKANPSAKTRVLKWTEKLHLSSHPIQTPLRSTFQPTSPPKSCLRSPVKTLFQNYTPNGKAVAFAPSSSPPSDSPDLSGTTWSIDHWRLLETILKTWDPANAEKYGVDDDREGNGNSMRVVSKLLGKKCKAGKEEMRLEQWHLEAVDEFRELVPGWEEGVVAMRVFGLVAGKKLRSRGERWEALRDCGGV